MAIFIYLFKAIVLLRYLVSPSYRTQTNERWKKTPTHSIIYEVGGGVMGLIVVAALVFLIFAKRN